jgi:hypothetical protein
VKFDGKAAAYDELMESEFGMKDEMLECEVWNELRCRAWWAALPERLEELEHNKLSSMMTEGLGIEDGETAVEESTASSWMLEQLRPPRRDAYRGSRLRPTCSAIHRGGAADTIRVRQTLGEASMACDLSPGRGWRPRRWCDRRWSTTIQQNFC